MAEKYQSGPPQPQSSDKKQRKLMRSPVVSLCDSSPQSNDPHLLAGALATIDYNSISSERATTSRSMKLPCTLANSAHKNNNSSGGGDCLKKNSNSTKSKWFIGDSSGEASENTQTIPVSGIGGRNIDCLASNSEAGDIVFNEIDVATTTANSGATARGCSDGVFCVNSSCVTGMLLSTQNVDTSTKHDELTNNARMCPSFSFRSCDEPDSSSSAALMSSNNVLSPGLVSSSATPPIPIKSMMGHEHHLQSPAQHLNEVSSTEFFSVYFDVDESHDCSTREKEEFIPATKGVILYDSLLTALRRRNLSFSQIMISESNYQNYADIGTPPYTNKVDKCTDAGTLAGRALIVTEKDYSRKTNHTLQKAASFGSRSRPAKLFQSVSTEDSTEHSSEVKGGSLQQQQQQHQQQQLQGKQPKQKWSNLFGLKNPNQSQLCELLNGFAKNGVPQRQSSYYDDENPEMDNALDYLESVHHSWMEFVSCASMTDTEVKIQSAIWELVTTEIDYIHALQTVTDLFLACLEALQSESLLTEIDQNKLFSNIRDICEANIKFWTLSLYPMVKSSIQTGHPMCVDVFQPGFVTFASTFAPYKNYCAEQSTCQFYCKELNRNNALFTAYLAWCESQKMCNRLRLADILVRPMQRLTKYSLLLSAIRKHITDENDAEIMDAMVHSVEDFVCSVNSHLTTRQENERLKGIMARIEAYDVVDCNNDHLEKWVKQYSAMFDLCAPMRGCAPNQGRHLFMEGDLKFKDNLNKMDVHCFLLTDVLLVCKTIAKKGQGALKVIRQPFLTDRLVIKVRDNTLYCVYLNEFNVAITAFTLQCSEAKSWHDAITKAKHIYSRLRQGSHWDGYSIRLTGSSASTNVDTLGVRKSPLNSSIGSRVSSLNNSHSGSVDLNESRNLSVDFEKANSLSSEEGAASTSQMSGVTAMKKVPQNSPTKYKGANTLVVQPLTNLGQSLPNLNLNASHSGHNTLLVPGIAAAAVASSSHHSNLLSPSHRGISYPPPSPTRGTLRRGFAFSASIKNPPLLKTRNITSQNSFSWLPVSSSAATVAAAVTATSSTNLAAASSSMAAAGASSSVAATATTPPNQTQSSSIFASLQASNESDV